MKLFGGTSGARTAKGHSSSGKKTAKKRNPFRALAVILAVILLWKAVISLFSLPKTALSPTGGMLTLKPPWTR